MKSHPLHQKALSLAKHFILIQAELLDVLQKIDREKLFRKWEFPSLFEYCRQALGLSESDTYTLIRVARKSVQVPELKEAVKRGEVNMSAAKRVASVITPDNKTQWLQKAARLPQRELEKEIIKENPKLEVPDKIKPIQGQRMELRCGISVEVEKLIRRVQDVESQKTKKACDLEQTLKAMAELYLQRHDPVRKAQRNIDKPNIKPKLDLRTVNTPRRSPIPASVKHRVVQRDQGRCQFRDQEGKHCGQGRWTALHHVQPISMGGKHTPDNLLTLCHHHHRAIHEGVNGHQARARL